MTTHDLMTNISSEKNSSPPCDIASSHESCKSTASTSSFCPCLYHDWSGMTRDHDVASDSVRCPKRIAHAAQTYPLAPIYLHTRCKTGVKDYLHFTPFLISSLSPASYQTSPTVYGCVRPAEHISPSQQTIKQNKCALHYEIITL